MREQFIKILLSVYEKVGWTFDPDIGHYMAHKPIKEKLNPQSGSDDFDAFMQYIYDLRHYTTYGFLEITDTVDDRTYFTSWILQLIFIGKDRSISVFEIKYNPHTNKYTLEFDVPAFSNDGYGFLKRNKSRFSNEPKETDVGELYDILDSDNDWAILYTIRNITYEEICEICDFFQNEISEWTLRISKSYSEANSKNKNKEEVQYE